MNSENKDEVTPSSGNIANAMLAEVPEYVMCSARRHGNIIAQMKALTDLRTVKNGTSSVGEYEQGFLTNKNRFVSREESGKIAFNAGQTKELKTYLFSEDVW